MGGGTWGRGAQVMIVNEWDCVQCAQWGDMGEGIPASPLLLPLYPRLPFRTDPARAGGCEEGSRKDTPSTLVGADSPRQDHDPDHHARHRANFQPQPPCQHVCKGPGMVATFDPRRPCLAGAPSCFSCT